MIQYCYTIPEAYTLDDFDYNDQRYHVDENFNRGSTIRFSKACSGDWYRPGTKYQKPDGSPIYHCDSEHFEDYYCNWYVEDLLETAVPSPDGYVTVLNCPRCGCTPGQNDVMTLDKAYVDYYDYYYSKS